MAKNKQIINGPHAIFIGKGIMLTNPSFYTKPGISYASGSQDGS